MLSYNRLNPRLAGELRDARVNMPQGGEVPAKDAEKAPMPVTNFADLGVGNSRELAYCDNPEANGMKEHPKNLGNCRVLEELRRVSSHAKNGTVRSVSGWPYPCKDSGVPSPQNATIAQ